MKTFDKLEMLFIYASFLVFIIFVLIGISIETVSKEEPNIPKDYHVLYDDEHKEIIVPNEYHFTCDEEGNMVLTK